MPGGIAGRGLSFEFQSLQRKHFRRCQIASAVLVVYRERASRFPREPPRASRHIEQLAPSGGSGFVAALAPRADGERPKRLQPLHRQRHTARRDHDAHRWTGAAARTG